MKIIYQSILKLHGNKYLFTYFIIIKNIENKKFMDWENDRIRKSFYGVIRDARILNSVKLEEKYADFKEAHEKLYNVAIESVVRNNVQESIAKLDILLKTRDDTRNNRMTQSTANLKIGNMLGHEYIYSKVGKTPSQADYKRAIDEIRKQEIENEKENEKEDK